jgi:ketosteroid isomerase-like protein
MDDRQVWRHSLLAAFMVGGVIVWTAPASAASNRKCPAPSLPSQDVVKSYIERSEKEWAKSVATNDASVVRRILADDFVWVLDGRLVDKKTAVEEATEGPGPFLTNVADYVHVRFFGKTAVAQGSETWSKTGGRRGKFVWTDTWVNRAGCWQIVNAQDTVVAIIAN